MLAELDDAPVGRARHAFVTAAVVQHEQLLGLARATAAQDFVRANLFAIQKDLVILMGELAVANAVA